MTTDKKIVERFAVSRLHLSGGRILKNQIIEIVEKDGRTVSRYYPLEKELAFTKWIGGDFYYEET